MSLLHDLLHRARGLTSRQRANRDLEDELLHHIELETEELIRRGMPPIEAQRQARLAFGGLGAVREQTREQRGTAAIEQTARDLRVGWRSLRRAPRFTVAALLTLALGVAGTLTIFAIADAVLLQPLPFGEPDRVVQVQELTPDGDPFSLSDLNLIDLRERSRTISGMAAMNFTSQELLFEPASAQTELTDQARRISAAQVTGNFFDVLGVRLLAGRTWTTDETAPGTNPRLVLVSDRFWQQHFERSPSLVGTTLRLAGEPWTVTGVLPPEFTFGLDADVFVPYVLDLERPRGDHRLEAFARLVDGIDPAAAELELREIYADMAVDYPRELGGWSVRLQPISDTLIGDSARTSTWALIGAVALLLLLACANVSCLLLARSSTRAHELATRRALGANRWRLTRQLLTESMLLGSLGVGLGCLAAFFALPLVRQLAHGALPRIENAGFDLRAAAVAVGLAVLTTLLSGTAPAWKASANTTANSRRTLSDGARLRSLLVVAQLAAALVLTVSSLVLLRSFGELRGVQPGFDTNDLIAVDIVLPRGAYSEGGSVVAYYEQTLETVRAIPGVEAAGGNVTHPFRGPRLANTVALPDVAEPREFLEIDWRSITDGALGAMGATLLRGRDFRADEQDLVCVLSAGLAERLFGDDDPVGRDLRWRAPDGPLMRVVGVVADMRDVDLSQPPRPTLYAYQQMIGWPDLTLLVRSDLPPEQLAAPLREAVRKADTRVAPPEITAVAQSLRQALSGARLNSQIFATFAAVALLIALVGLYGLLAFTTASRSDEIGLRVALGARPPQIRALVLVQAGRLLAGGVAIGLLGQLLGTRLIEQLLFETEPLDPLVLTLGVGCFVLLALLAALLPAQRAAHLDPLRALRTD